MLWTPSFWDGVVVGGGAERWKRVLDGAVGNVVVARVRQLRECDK
ncbi:hypothetical protein L195_g004918, partial [Trifolium pratense]